MNAIIDIAIALFVFFAIFSLLRGNVAGAIAGIAAALTLGLLSMSSSDDDYRRRLKRGPWDA
jgi:hypothetical protein